MQKRTNEPQRRLEEESQNPQPAEPVKVPSEPSLLEAAREILLAWDELLNPEDGVAQDLRRALDRSGQPAQPAASAEPPTSD